MLNSINIGFFGIRIAYILRNIQWDMRHGVWKINEKGLFLVRINKIYGLLCIAAGDGSLVCWKLNDFFIFNQWCLPLSQSRFRIFPEDIHAFPASARLALVIWVIHVIGVWNPVVCVEAVCGRQYFFMVS